MATARRRYLPGRASAKRYGSPSRKRRPSWTSRFSVSSPDKVMRNGTSRSRGATPGQLVMPRTPPFGVVSLLADAASVTGDALAVRSPPSTSPASTSQVRAITNSGVPGWLWFTTPELLDGLLPAIEMRQRDAEREPQLEVARFPVERGLVLGRRAGPVVAPRQLIAFLLERADGRPHGRRQRVGRP